MEIQFSQTRNRKCLKLGYDSKTLLLSREKIIWNIRKSWMLLRRVRILWIINKFPHIFVGIAGSLDWSYYENLQMVCRTKSYFYVKNFSFLIIFLSKSLYKGQNINEKYRKKPYMFYGTVLCIKKPQVL
jgi:hypothetical protein